MTLLAAAIVVIALVPLVFVARTAAGFDRGPAMAAWIGFSPLILQLGWLGVGAGIAVGLNAGPWSVAGPAVALSAGVAVAGAVAFWRASTPGEVTPQAAGIGLRVVTANVFYRNPDGADAWPTLAAFQPDVVLVQEVSHLSGAWLPPPGWHCASVIRDDAFGTAILTREPLVEWSVVSLDGLPQLRAVVNHHGHEVVVYCVHPRAPAHRQSDVVWRRQFRDLAELLREEPDDRPVLVGGDFNATPLHRPFRELLAENGFVDARPAHRRLAATWPSGGAGSPTGVPRVMSLDHVLVRGAAIRSAAVLAAMSGDHLPVAVEIALPG